MRWAVRGFRHSCFTIRLAQQQFRPPRQPTPKQSPRMKALRPTARNRRRIARRDLQIPSASSCARAKAAFVSSAPNPRTTSPPARSWSAVSAGVAAPRRRSFTSSVAASAARSVCASAISGNSGVGVKPSERGREHGMGVGRRGRSIDIDFASESAARSSKLRAFCSCAIAMALMNASSAGAVFAGSRFSRDLAAEAVQERVRPSALPSRFASASASSIRVNAPAYCVRFGFDLSQQALVKRQVLNLFPFFGRELRGLVAVLSMPVSRSPARARAQPGQTAPGR